MSTTRNLGADASRMRIGRYQGNVSQVFSVCFGRHPVCRGGFVNSGAARLEGGYKTTMVRRKAGLFTTAFGPTPLRQLEARLRESGTSEQKGQKL